MGYNPTLSQTSTLFFCGVSSRVDRGRGIIGAADGGISGTQISMIFRIFNCADIYVYLVNLRPI